ncbi:hypothetical protein BC937DRAFT_89299 [Endogone sp. FLAS-F59071]|nr:hypothetical protein BC937DRAFT_89299 [Endogone sp. FLAS-F59071]|eukprot:RUS17972.1 hypothetical protein BC937DRAFT_89299 [Endogone sp. FLAS-F59071]
MPLRLPTPLRFMPLKSPMPLRSPILFRSPMLLKPPTPLRFSMSLGSPMPQRPFATLVILLKPRRNRNERSVLKALERGSCPKHKVDNEVFIPHPDVMAELKSILNPQPRHSSYHIIVGELGTGKTTMVKEVARTIKKGVIYIDIGEFRCFG